MIFKSNKNQKEFLIFVGIITVVLLFLFRDSFSEGKVLFSSDGPLSTLVTAHNQIPDGFSGKWQDIYKMGKPAGAAPVNVTWMLLWLLTPELFAKFYIPICLIILGISIWCAGRAFRFHPLVCGLVGIAGILNSDFFSYGCWGLGTVVLAAAFFFFAISVWKSAKTFGVWGSSILSGLCLGICVMEGFDVGIILSMLFALFVAWEMFEPKSENNIIESGDNPEQENNKKFPLSKIKPSLIRLCVTTGFSILVAMQTVFSLFSTQIQGVSILERNDSNQSKWEWATQWSLPINETVRLFVPGYFGYRMDTDNGGLYRGTVGRDPQYGKDNTPRISRHSGSGFYAGNFVIFAALMAGVILLSRKNSFFNSVEKHWVWFWSIIVFSSLAFSFGRHFFLYQIIHALPFFNSIRNPIKFHHTLEIGLIFIFFVFLHAIWRGKGEHLKELLKSNGLLKSVMIGVPVFCSLIFLVIAGSRFKLQDQLKKSLGAEGYPNDSISQIPSFVLGEYLWFLFFTLCTFTLMYLVFKGTFHKGKMGWLGAIIAALLLLDMGRANLPWIQHFNAGIKYDKDVLIDTLEPVASQAGARVTIAPFDGNKNINVLAQLYRAEWLQHQFPYYNINSIDISQEPRPAADFLTFQNALSPTGNPENLRRFWELTSTKYLLGLSQGVTEILNDQFDPKQKRFKILKNFSIDNNYKSINSQTGPFSVIEFSGALDRIKIYDQWEVIADDKETLKKLSEPFWNPQKSVIVNSPIPSSKAMNDILSTPSISLVSYAPKKIILSATSSVPAIVLLNDNYDSNWKVDIDGKKVPLLRCNFISKGVYLEPAEGKQKITFEYKPVALPLKVTMASISIGLIFFLLPAIPFTRKKV